MSEPTWLEIQSAIQDVVETASGLTAIWRDQNAPQPATDYLDITLGVVKTVDIDFVDERYDAMLVDYEQVALTVIGTREVQLRLQAWSATAVETIAEMTARQVLDAVVTRLRLPLARAALLAVGVVPFDPGPVQWLPTIVQVGFRGRATCDVRCRMPARMLQEFTDYIASVAGQAHIEGGPAGVIDEDLAAP